MFYLCTFFSHYAVHKGNLLTANINTVKEKGNLNDRENQKIHPLQNRHRHTLTNHKPKKVEKISFCFSALCLCMRFLAAASGSIFCLLMGKMNLYPNKLFMVTRELQKKNLENQSFKSLRKHFVLPFVKFNWPQLSKVSSSLIDDCQRAFSIISCE